jgi:predicted PurR-regulated permease PerM
VQLALDAERESARRSVLVYASAAGLTALTTYLMVVGAQILLPLVIAVLVWHLINGMVAALATISRRIQFRGKSVPPSVRLIVATAVVLLLAWLLVNLLVGNVGQVVAKGPTYEQNLRNVANQVSGLLGLEEWPDEQPLFEKGRITGMIRGLARSMTGIVGSGGTIAVYVLFLLLEQHSFSRKITILFPDPAREAAVRNVLTRIGAEIQSYIWLKTLMGLLVTAASYVVMKAVGVDLAEFWALLIFALSYIPYIGAWLGVVFPTLLALVQFETVTPFFVTAGTLAIIQFACGSIIEPRIMGKGLNISPLIMLLSLSVWAAIWGVVGMFLAVPLMVVVMIVCSHFDVTRPVAVLLSAQGQLKP